jgi:hypothetical protein
MVIADLLGADLVSEVYTAKEKVRAYTPAKDVRMYTIRYVGEALDKKGNNHILNKPADDLKKVLHIQENFLQAIENMPDNILIQDLSDDNK